MAQISAVIASTDYDFRVHITRVLRTSGLPISVVDEKHVTNGAAPDLAVVDIRNGTVSALQVLEQFRTAWPSAASPPWRASTG